MSFFLLENEKYQDDLKLINKNFEPILETQELIKELLRKMCGRFILKSWRRYKLFFQKPRLNKIKKIQRWWLEIYYRPGGIKSLKIMKNFNNLKTM